MEWKPDDRIVSVKQSAEIAGVSLMTWARLERLGDTPPRVHISPRRIGYLLSDLHAWLEARKEPAR